MRRWSLLNRCFLFILNSRLSHLNLGNTRYQRLLLLLAIIQIIEIDIPSRIEQVVRRIAHYLRGVLDILNIIVVESIPRSLVLCISSIMTSKQLPVMIRYAEEVIDQGLCLLLLLADHEIAHVKPFNREMHQRILFLLHPFETL